jgi:hypothetical protein
MELAFIHQLFRGFLVACRIVFCFVTLSLGVFAEVNAQEAAPAIYQRSRDIAFANGGGGHGHNGGNWGGAFYNPWFGTQFYAGTWYQRPYPDHLIYNNVRSHMVPIQQATPACPAACGVAE